MTVALSQLPSSNPAQSGHSVTAVRQPLQQLNTSIPRPITQKVDAQKYLLGLIQQSHLPKVLTVSIAQEEEMGNHMRHFCGFVKQLVPAEPTFWGSKKQFSHPIFNSPVRFTWFFEELMKAFQEIRTNRPARELVGQDGSIKIIGGPNIWHFAGCLDMQASLKKIKDVSAGQEIVEKSGKYCMLITRPTPNEFHKIYPNQPVYNGLYGLRIEQLHAAAAKEPKQHCVIEALSEEYLAIEAKKDEKALAGLEASRQLTALIQNNANTGSVGYTYAWRVTPDGSMHYGPGYSGQKFTYN